jgi:hypothetical protein
MCGRGARAGNGPPCSRAAVTQTGAEPCAGRLRPAGDGRVTITSQARSFGRAAAGCAASRSSCPPALTAGHRPWVFPGRSQACALHGLRPAVPRHERGYRQGPQRHPVAWVQAPDTGRGQVAPVGTTWQHQDRSRVADVKPEVVVAAVADADRAGDFCEVLGRWPDADSGGSGGLRAVQFTPSDSSGSVFGAGLPSPRRAARRACTWRRVCTWAVCGVKAAHAELAGRGVAVCHDTGGVFHRAGTKGHVAGPGPGPGSCASFLVPLVRRSGRQRPAAAGDHGAAFGPVAEASAGADQGRWQGARVLSAGPVPAVAASSRKTGGAAWGSPCPVP